MKMKVANFEFIKHDYPYAWHDAQ